MRDDTEIDWALIARFLSNECRSEERRLVERWMESSPEVREEVQRLRKLWDDAGAVPSASRLDTMWQSLSRRMDGDSLGSAPLAPRISRATPSHRTSPPFVLLPRRAPRFGWRYRVAAALAASVVVVVSGTLMVRSRGGEPPATVAAEPRTFATVPGQRATIRLLDGTRVELGYASSLTVLPFTNERREMVLVGEAVFDVVHDSTRSFIVRAGNAVTEDLGTTFSVRAYSRDEPVRVMVVSGLVAVRPLEAVADTTGVVLSPGHLASLDSLGRIRVDSSADTSAALGWLTGRVVYRNAPLAEVVGDLARRFDLTIEVRDPALARRRLTINMPGDRVGDVLDAIAVTLDLRHRRDGDVVVFSRRS